MAVTLDRSTPRKIRFGDGYLCFYVLRILVNSLVSSVFGSVVHELVGGGVGVFPDQSGEFIRA